MHERRVLEPGKIKRARARTVQSIPCTLQNLPEVVDCRRISNVICAAAPDLVVWSTVGRAAGELGEPAGRLHPPWRPQTRQREESQRGVVG